VGNLDEFINPVDKFIHFSSQKRPATQSSLVKGGKAASVNRGDSITGSRASHDRKKRPKPANVSTGSKYDSNRRRRISSSENDESVFENLSDGGGAADGGVKELEEQEELENEGVESDDSDDDEEVYNEKATFADDDSDGNEEDDEDEDVNQDDVELAKDEEERTDDGVVSSSGEVAAVAIKNSADDTRSFIQPASKSTHLNRSTLDTLSVSDNNSVIRSSFRNKTYINEFFFGCGQQDNNST
jgi:hypothetical protein